METRANHLFIGAFVLAMVAAMFGFLVWVTKTEVDKETDRYHIYFEGSVTGLSTAGEVFYNGIRVGSVTEIIIDPDNPRRVRVTAELAEKTPVRTNTVASLELRVLTGVSYINLTTGEEEGAPLTAMEGEALPVIASGPSTFEAIVTSVPQAIKRFNQVMSQASELLNKDNQEAFAAILQDVAVFTHALAAESDRVGEILDTIQGTTDEVRGIATSVNRIAGDVELLIDEADETLALARGTLVGFDEILATDIRGLIKDTRETLASVEAASELMQAVVADNREALKDFSTEGLYELSRFIVEARFLVSSLSRLAANLEEDPSQFIFGGTEAGFEADK